MYPLTTRLSAVLLLTYLSVGSAENDVIGTVELRLDGHRQVWYVLAPGNDMLPTATWMAMGPDKATTAIGAFKSIDVEFVRDERTGSPKPVGDAETVVISLGFPVGAGNQSYTFPSKSPAGRASLLFVTDWSDPGSWYDMSGDPGHITVTEIDAQTDGPSRFAGTFSGLLRNSAGDTMTVEDGRFEVGGVPFLK